MSYVTPRPDGCTYPRCECVDLCKGNMYTAHAPNISTARMEVDRAQEALRMHQNESKLKTQRLKREVDQAKVRLDIARSGS